MTKNELIEELQKVEGNPQISIAIDRTWGKESYFPIRVTPLYKHDSHKVDPNACIFEIIAENKIEASPEQIADRHKLYMIKKYGPLSLCSIDESFWAVNGPWISKWNREKIEQLEAEIAKLKMEKESLRQQVKQLNKNHPNFLNSLNTI